MRNVILGAVAGLALGSMGALAYSQYLGDGKRLDDLQAQLDAANDKLAKDAQEKQSLSQETSGVSDQVDQLQATNADLKKQLDDLKKSPAGAGPAINPMTLMGMMRGMMRGGQQGQQRMLLLQTRLHLTPDQTAALKAAMDADEKSRRDAFQQLRNGGKVNPPAPGSNAMDQALASVLTPDQQTAYKQVQADEQASRADMSATVQVDQIAPLLQLNDTQRDQVQQALYQIQMTAPDPGSLMGNPNAASVIAAQAQATQDALAKVLTPDQLALYQQQAQAAPAFGGGGPRGGRGGGGGGGGDQGGGGQGGGGQGGGAPAAAAAPAATSNQ